jgi:hypothetical protein
MDTKLSLWQATARKPHNFIRNLNLMGNSQNVEGLDNHKEVRKVPYRRRTATSLCTSLPLRHLAPHHCQSFVILTKVYKPSKLFETSRPLYSTNPTTLATHSDVTPLAIRMCKNLAQRKMGHRFRFIRLPTAPSMAHPWNRQRGSQQNWHCSLLRQQVGLHFDLNSAALSSNPCRDTNISV